MILKTTVTNAAVLKTINYFEIALTFVMLGYYIAQL